MIISIKVYLVSLLTISCSILFTISGQAQSENLVKAPTKEYIKKEIQEFKNRKEICSAMDPMKESKKETDSVKAKAIAEEGAKAKIQCYTEFILDYLALPAQFKDLNDSLKAYCSILKEETDLLDIASHVMGYKAGRRGKRRCSDRKCIWRSANTDQKRELIYAIHTKLTSEILTYFLPLSSYNYEIKSLKKKRLHVEAFQAKLVYPDAPGANKFGFTSTIKSLKLHDIEYALQSLRSFYSITYSRYFKHVSGTTEKRINSVIKKIIKDSGTMPNGVDPLCPKFEISDDLIENL